jgi:hypothetical protein
VNRFSVSLKPSADVSVYRFFLYRSSLWLLYWCIDFSLSLKSLITVLVYWFSISLMSLATVSSYSCKLGLLSTLFMLNFCWFQYTICRFFSCDAINSLFHSMHLFCSPQSRNDITPQTPFRPSLLWKKCCNNRFYP